MQSKRAPDDDPAGRGDIGDKLAGCLGIAKVRVWFGVAHARSRPAFIAWRLAQLVNDMAGLKDDMMMVMARLDRLDATTHSLVTEVRAMHSRHDRVVRRVEHLEEADREAPS